MFRLGLAHIYFELSCFFLVFFRPVFTQQQENDLEDYLLFMENRFFGLTLTDFRQLSFQFAVRNNVDHPFNKELEMAGSDFVYGFLMRHQRLSLRSPEATSAARAAGFNKVAVAKFYELLDSLYGTYNFPPSRIYNNDETGVMTVPNKTSKIISMKGKKQVGTLVSAERGTLVTAEICFNALGNYIPPLFVFPRKKTNPLFEVGAPPETVIACHPSGWMHSEIFAPTWFNHFLHYTKPTAEDPVLLIFDGHATHTKNLTLIEMARENHVHILVIPPHTSHRLQPLDVSFMGPLNTYYEQEVRVWLRNHPGKVVTIYQVAALFGAAYQKAATSSTALSGFAKTGICPFNPHTFQDYMFAASETTDKPAPGDEPTPSQAHAAERGQGAFNAELPVQVPSDVAPPAEATSNVAPPAQAPSNVAPPPQAPSSVAPSVRSSSNVASNVAPPPHAPFNLAQHQSTSVCSTLSNTPANNKDDSDYVSPSDIMGVPQVKQTEPRKRGIKRGKTVILTSSPYLKEM